MTANSDSGLGLASDVASAGGNELLQSLNEAFIALTRSESLYEGRFEDITETAARTLKVARASVWLYNADRSAIQCVDLYELSADAHSKGSELLAEDFPAYFEALRTERSIAAADAHTDPRTRDFSEPYLKPLGISAMLDAPIRMRGEMVGVVCHEHIDGPREWSVAEQRFAGSMADFCAVALEAAERRRAEDALRESEGRYRTLFESANDGLFMMEGERFVECNPMTLSIFGCQRDELIGKTPFDFSPPMQPDGRPSRECGMEKISLVLGGQSVCFDWRHRRANGELFDAEVSLTRVDLSDRVYVLAIVRDITDRKRTQRELAAYRNRLEDLVEERTQELQDAQAALVDQERMAALGKVAATVSHEIRNPLQTIRGTFYLIAQSLETAPREVQDMLNRIERSVMRCDGIIEDLGEYTRADRINAHRVVLDVWVGKLLDQQVLPEDVAVRRNLDAGVAVALDRNRVQRSIEHVLQNACQAFEERAGQPRVPDAVIAVETRVSGDRAEIRIVDNGPGIPMDGVARALEPFFSTKGFGVGLGLSIAQAVMKLHGGGVEIESEVGKGTTVTLWLPVLAEGEAGGGACT